MRHPVQPLACLAQSSVLIDKAEVPPRTVARAIAGRVKRTGPSGIAGEVDLGSWKLLDDDPVETWTTTGIAGLVEAVVTPGTETGAGETGKATDAEADEPVVGTIMTASASTRPLARLESMTLSDEPVMVTVPSGSQEEPEASTTPAGAICWLTATVPSGVVPS